MHLKPAVMTLDFVRKMERKTTQVPQMTVMYWKSGSEFYIFVGERPKAPDTKHAAQQSVLPCCTERSLIREPIDGGLITC